MIGVLGHDSALYGYTGPETTWTNEMNFVTNHAPGIGTIVRPVVKQSSALQVERLINYPIDTKTVLNYKGKYLY